MNLLRRRLLAVLALAVLSLGGNVAQAQSRSGDAASTPARIAVIYFVHETVTFLPYDTTLEDFIYEGSPATRIRAEQRFPTGGSMPTWSWLGSNRR